MKKKLIVIIVAVAFLLLLKKYDVFYLFSFENINELKNYIHSFGMVAPIVFIAFFIASTIFFVPGLPITILAGVLFGTAKGTLYVIVGSSIGVSIAFLMGRYLGRDMVQKAVEKNEKMAKLDQYIKEQGNMILIISRLIPLFPFNLQNYAYGITDISFKTYFWYSFIFMIPGTFIYTAFGALAYTSMPTEQFVLYTSVLLVALCMLIIVPKKVFKVDRKEGTTHEL
ncbi:MAG: TVP38/TMEM64 family protein [Clostridia bacterium]|nr:TVP38/TMEM64 family protein [Clostridia bacterium]